MKTKIAILVNTSWNISNFRSGLIRTLVNSGFEVIAITPHDQYVDRIRDLGCLHVSVDIDNKGTSIVKDIGLLYSYFKILVREKPELILCFTIKPNIYASIVAHALKIPVINNIAGLGAVFNMRGWLNLFVRSLYRIALARSLKVFFQNDDDHQLFVSGGLVPVTITDVLPGSGIDLDRFRPNPLPSRPIIRFLLVARMLWEKGVGEYVEAARILKLGGINAECCLLGFLEVQNPGAISHKQMNEWVAEGFVRYLGVSDNVCEDIANADCVVLPSYYREGTPRTLLEAAAMSRPIITTDSVGCRNVVDDGINGFLCKPKDAVDLANKMERIVRMSPAQREVMGSHSRIKVEREFDEQIVIRKYLQVIDEALDPRDI